MAEAGYGKEVVAPWFAVLVPRSTPREIVTRIESAIQAAVASPDVVARIKGAGAVPAFESGERTTKMIQDEIARWRELVRATGLKAE